ncbi:MAG: hypothetical protein A2162_06640 [Deltaproteobacteria bacterium RBG_13_52_11b]|nr:MAG: hypothetical protein A2162_06640 [Deltaproteobacteria bacterium RBG_13_52_11b]
MQDLCPSHENNFMDLVWLARVPRVSLLTGSEVKLPAHRAGLPGNVDTITVSALTPVLESVAALPAYKAGHPAEPAREGVDRDACFFGGEGLLFIIGNRGKGETVCLGY